MAFLDLAEVRIAQSITFLLLLTFSSTALASDCQVFNSVGHRSRRSLSILKAQGLVERKLAALAPDSVITGNNAPAPTPSSLLPPPPSPSDDRPAVVTPSGNAPGSDLPPYEVFAPPPSGSQSAPAAPITPPASSPGKQSNVAVILGVTLGVLVFLLVSLSAAAYLKPDWLPCFKGRSSRLTQYERHMEI